jgi:hypothetical protein
MEGVCEKHMVNRTLHRFADVIGVNPDKLAIRCAAAFCNPNFCGV